MHGQIKRLLECCQHVKAAQTYIAEVCDDKVYTLADVNGLATIDKGRMNDLSYLQAAAISRCILVQKESNITTNFKNNGQNVCENAVFHARRMNGTCGWKERSLLGKCQTDNVLHNKSLIISIRYPGMFLQSSLFLNICEIVGSDLMLNILLSYRMLVPEHILNISVEAESTKRTKDVDGSDYTYSICGALKRAILVMDGPDLGAAESKGESKPFVFIQCSGSVMYDSNLREQKDARKWCTIELSRHVMLYKDSFSRKFGFLASDLLGAVTKSFSQQRHFKWPNQDCAIKAEENKSGDSKTADRKNDNANLCAVPCVSELTLIPKIEPSAWMPDKIDHTITWKLLQYVLFDKGFTCTSFAERSKSVKAFIGTLATSTSKTAKPRRGSMLYGIYRLFQEFIINLARFDIRRTYWSMFRKVKASNSCLESSVSCDLVIRFVHKVVEEIVPEDLLGCPENFIRLKEVCKSVVILNKGEKLDMSQVMTGFRAKGCCWSRNSTGSLAKSQTCTILEYLCRIVFLILEHLVIPLLQRHFYITETNFTIYRLMYFLKAHWYKMIMSENIAYLSNVGSIEATQSFEKKGKLNATAMGIQDTDRGRTKGIRVRWVPKLTGMRPIMNCKTPSTCPLGVSKFRSYNDIMQLPFHALSANIRMSPELLGNGTLGYVGAFKSLKRWWIRFLRLIRLKKYTTDYLRLYVILADVSRCYDNIPHKGLLEALDRITLQGPMEFKHIYRRDLIKVASFTNTYSRRITVLSNKRSMNRTSEHERITYRNIGQFSICSRHANDYFSTTVSGGDVISSVRDLLSQFQISLPKISPDVYIRRKVGIPQGCCISPLLCSLFLAQGDMEENVKRLTETSRGNLFLRWIDDFIFISINEDDVMDMMKVLRNNSVFGVEMNHKCSIIHVDIPLKRDPAGVTQKYATDKHQVVSGGKCSNGRSSYGNAGETLIPKGSCTMETENSKNSEESQDFLWINSTFDFDIPGGHLNASLKPWKNNHASIRDSLSLSRMRSSTFMFAFMEQRLLGYLSNRLQHGLFTNARLNGTKCILQNAYITMRICIMKMKCAASALLQHFGGFVNCKYFGRLSHKLVGYAFMLVSRRGFVDKHIKLRRVLQLAVIYTLKPQWVSKLKNKFGLRLIRFIHSIEKKLKEEWPVLGDECFL